MYHLPNFKATLFNLFMASEFQSFLEPTYLTRWVIFPYLQKALFFSYYISFVWVWTYRPKGFYWGWDVEGNCLNLDRLSWIHHHNASKDFELFTAVVPTGRIQRVKDITALQWGRLLKLIKLNNDGTHVTYVLLRMLCISNGQMDKYIFNLMIGFNNYTSFQPKKHKLYLIILVYWVVYLKYVQTSFITPSPYKQKWNVNSISVINEVTKLAIMKNPGF